MQEYGPDKYVILLRFLYIGGSAKNLHELFHTHKKKSSEKQSIQLYTSVTYIV